MNRNEKARVDSAGSFEKNQDRYVEIITESVPPQQRFIATGKLRADLIERVYSLPAVAEGHEHFDFRTVGPHAVLDLGFARRDGSEAVNLCIIFQGWQPQLFVPAMDFYRQLLDAGFLADAARYRAAQNGRTILTAGNREAVREDLAEVNRMLDELQATAQDQRNWAAIPEGVVVSVEWWPVLPAGVAQ